MNNTVSIYDVNAKYAAENSRLESVKMTLQELKNSASTLENPESLKALILRLDNEVSHYPMPEKKTFNGSLDKEEIQKMWKSLSLTEVAIPEALRVFYVKEFEENLNKIGIAVAGIQVFVAEKLHIDNDSDIFECIYRSVVICANGVWGVDFQVYYSCDSNDCRFTNDCDKTSDLITSPNIFENKYSLMNQSLGMELGFHEEFAESMVKYCNDGNEYAFRYIDLMEM